MSTTTFASQKHDMLYRRDLKGYDVLEKLALDQFWTWNHGADKVWQRLDAALWEMLRNPWVVLQTISTKRLEEALNDDAFSSLIHALYENSERENQADAWFQKNHSKSALTGVAYFSMEFMLSEALPIYSGGLGNVAGDQLKAASDLGVPVIGISLLYQQGYFRQVIDKEGRQEAIYPFNDPGQLPVTPLRKADGEWLRLEVALPGFSIWLRTWQVTVGRVKLYLLDSNDAANFPSYRASLSLQSY